MIIDKLIFAKAVKTRNFPVANTITIADVPLLAQAMLFTCLQHSTADLTACQRPAMSVLNGSATCAMRCHARSWRHRGHPLDARDTLATCSLIKDLEQARRVVLVEDSVAADAVPAVAAWALIAYTVEAGDATGGARGPTGPRAATNKRGLACRID